MTFVIVNRVPVAVANDVRQKMIERTAVLLAKRGLQGTSFAQILEESGAPRGSLYHHFPGGKDELVLAAIEAAGDAAAQRLETMMGRPAIEVAEVFTELWRQVLLRSDFAAGCAVAAVTVAAQTPTLRDKAGEIFTRWQNLLERLFAAGGIADKKTAALATGLIAACEGAVILSRATASLVPFERVAKVQLRVIRKAMAKV
jgi:TetR/AcrR family transcriptional regulator, lmrAB and yxaGH operons repressor